MFNYSFKPTPKPSPRAEAFLRLAENWFNIIEADVFDVRVPNLDEPVCSQVEADVWVLKLEGFFKKHLYVYKLRYDMETHETVTYTDVNEYFKGKGIDQPPGFDRIVGTPAALAMKQDWERLTRKWEKKNDSTESPTDTN